MFSTRKYLWVLQAVVWALSFSFFFIYLAQRLRTYPTAYVLGVAGVSFLSFGAIIYGYIFLYDRFFARVRLGAFVGIVAVGFVSVALLRMVLENEFVVPLAGGRNSIFYYGKVHWTYTLTSCFFALIIGVLSKSFLEMMFLRTRQAEIQKKHLETELMQLKAHVQPHFLFNSLNNLYYDTYKALPDVAGRIAMLSGIMRYFMEDSPKEVVPIGVEVQFIESYIALEKVRLQHPVSIRFEKDVAEGVKVPPMLFIPLVENVFKHGIRNHTTDNSLCIHLKEEEGTVQFRVVNTVSPTGGASGRRGTGLHNLRERLHLLYGDRAVLATQRKDNYFIAELRIPLYED